MNKKFCLLTIPLLLLSSCQISVLSFGDSVTSDNRSEPISSEINSSDNPISSSLESLSNQSSSSEKEDTSYKGYAPSGYELGWHDEFSNTRLSDDWEAMHGDGSDYGVYRWGNNEDQFYTEHNFYLKEDVLHIFAQKERTVTENHTYEVTSARLRTKGKVTMKYGYIEARIKLPAGTGLW